MEKIVRKERENLGYEIISEEAAKEAGKVIADVVANIETVIKGKHQQVEMVLLTMLAEGHVLIEDIPGTGKTSLVSSLARSVGCDYKRIQFTPDVMPSDISGFSVYNQKSGEFEFRPGAAMSNLVLADEINRASAKTQSAMLEMMEERQVTVDGVTYRMESPFIVLATQNPIDQLGTYQLPEAQIDRFMVKLSMGYPEFSDELSIVMHGRQNRSELNSIISGEDVKDLIEKTSHVDCGELVSSYIVRIAEATRHHGDVKLGASPRGSIALYSLSRAYALARGRNYVIPDDIKYLAPYVLAHRLILTHGAKTEKKDPKAIIEEIVKTVAVPTGR
ncbi:MAG: MoxR family ATPase [Clostridia bacterium]|nr:MoxR family ATPase [Clostridia bacterium]